MAEAAPRKRKAAPTASELMAQAREAFLAYNPGLATEKINELKKLKKGVDTDSLSMLEAKVKRMEEMIQRVEDVVIVDSMTVSRDDFFRHYRLSPGAGILASAEEAGLESESAGSTAVYQTPDESTMIWGGESGLMQSRRFTDGTWENPEPLSEVLNNGGTANYPYLLSDGLTLYFATEGDDSLGGLDIYMSRSNRGEYSQPLNLGMPYNSPYDDYMMAIDEETGTGWFATDRNQLEGLVTIYVFIPSQRRVNLNVDRPDLSERARISSIAATRPEGSGVFTLPRMSAPHAEANGADEEPDFTLVFPSGQVYTRWDQFRSPQARRLMETLEDARNSYKEDREALNALRAKYASGEHDTAQKILALERKTRTSREGLKRLSNQVITTETEE